MVDTADTALPATQLATLHQGIQTAANKGRALEEFCASFFSAIPGVEVHDRNVLDDAHSQEVDLTLWNDKLPDGLPVLDPILFVEAKNWSSPVGSAEVAWFDWKIRLSGYKQGFLVASTGITGRADDRTSAWRIVEQANMEERRLIVLSPDEMVGCSTSNEFLKLVKRKLMQIAAHNAQL